jgi:hypothetical protein
MSVATTRPIRPWAISVTLAVLAVAYVIQIPTPLRMNTDAIAYLMMASSYHDGHGFVPRPGAAHFPTGYPAIVAALDHFGVANSRAFVAVNELMLAATLWAGVWLIRRWLDLPLGVALAVAAVVLLSRSTIRYSAIPGSEFAYMLVATLGLACLTRSVDLPPARTNLALTWWGLGVLSVASIWFRAVGVVMVPAIGWSLVLILWQRRRTPLPLRQWATVNRTPLIMAAAVVLALGLAGSFVVSRTSYFHDGTALFRQNGVLTEVWFTLRQRMIETGSFLTNFWYREVDPRHQQRLMLAGLIAMPLTLLVIARRLRHPGPVDIYIVGYVALLMVWPYKADNRFWLPIQLFVYALFARELLTAANRGRAWARPIAIAWAGLFVITGIIALTWSTRLTYAGDRFSDRFDLEFMRDAYRAASRNGPPNRPTPVDPDLLAMIRRYGGPQFGIRNSPLGDKGY